MNTYRIMTLRLYNILLPNSLMEKAVATHSGSLAWRIPGTVEPGGLLFLGSHRVGHDWRELAAAATALYLWFYHHWQSQLLCRWLQNGDFLSFSLHLLGNSCFVNNFSPFILFQYYCGLIIIYNLFTLILKLSKFYQWEPLLSGS